MSGAVNSTIGCSNVHQIPNYVNGNYYSDDVQPKTRSSMLVDRRAFTSDRDAETNPKLVFLPPVYSNTLASSNNFVDNADGLYNDTAALITDSSDSETNYEVSSPKCTNRTKIIFTIIIVVLLLLSTAAVLLKIFLFNTVDCSAPSSDPNGSLSCSSGSGKYPSGSTCALTCKEGFGVRTGAVKSTCRHGTWSGGLGKCSKLGICSQLPVPANNGLISCTNKFYEMSNCSFSCPSGYRLRGNGIVTSSLCEVIGGDITKTKWSNPESYCEKVTTCPPLPGSTTVKFVCTNTQVSNGTVCTAVCSHGFAVKGIPSVKCENDGQWNTTVLPYCQTVCPLPEYLAGGSYTCTQARFVTSVCTFTCKPNFTLVGPVRTTCMPKGDWTSRVPICMCPSCRAGTDCEVERTWNSTVVQMTQALSKPNTKFHYGVETIMCVSKPQSNSTYSCYCKDIPTNRMKQCNNYPDKLTACTRSLASLILMMSFDGGYVIPCDAEYMPPSCL